MSRSRQHPLIIGKKTPVTDQLLSTEESQDRKLAWFKVKRRIAMLSRWLHIYLSMLSFVLVFFFAVTGLTLNHADKFGDQVHTEQKKGNLDPLWVNMPDTAKVAKLEIVEYLRNTHGIKAALSDFRIDDSEIGVSFKGPGYAADAFINRKTGAYDLSKTSAGFVGIINDLHKGRDTGPVWSMVIDVAALLMAIVSLSGMLLLLFIKRRRLSGLLAALFGLFMVYLVYRIWVH
jgi:hypothetical protein